MERLCRLPPGLLNKNELPGLWLWSEGTRSSPPLSANSLARSYTTKATLKIPKQLEPVTSGFAGDGPVVDTTLAVPYAEHQQFVLGAEFRLISPGHDVFGLSAYERLTGVKHPLVDAPDDVTRGKQIGLIGRWALDRRNGILVTITQFVDGWHLVVKKFDGRHIVNMHVALALRDTIVSSHGFALQCAFCGLRNDGECECPLQMTMRWMDFFDNKAARSYFLITNMLHSASDLKMSPAVDLLAYGKDVETGAYVMRHPFNFGLSCDINPTSMDLCDLRSRVCAYITGANVAVHLLDDSQRLALPNAGSKEQGALSRGQGNEKARVYFCPRCSQSFRLRHLLESHIRAAHKEVRPFQCELCHLRFATPGNLNRHTRNVHSNVKQHSCHLCDAMFAARFDLKRHLRGVHRLGAVF